MKFKKFNTTYLIRICIITIIINLFTIQIIFAQNTGLNFQGVARNPSGVILASQNISLRFSILNTSTTGNEEYIETRIVTTNGQGVFSLVIGDGSNSVTVQLGKYELINWKLMPKFLKVELDPSAGNNFFTMGVTQLQTVPYSNYSNYSASVDADNIIGLVPVARGGTGVSDLSTLKSKLELENVNNTSDINKPISLATQNSLNNKLAISDSLIVYITPTQLKNSSIDTTYLSNRINLKVENADLNDRLILKENASNKSTAVDLGGANASDDLYPSQKAVKTYIVANASAGSIADGGITSIKLADGAIIDSKVNFTSPNLGTPMVLIGTNITGTALGLSIGGNAGTATNANYATNAGNASTVTTNANLSGVVTSVGNLTSIADGVINNAMLSGNIAASKLVGNDISNVGTITTGTWSGTLIAVDKGGTGVSSTTANFVFAGPSSQNGAPSFRTLTSSDIPPNLTGYIQNTPSGTQSATINISGSLIADGIKMYAGDNSLLNLSVGVDALESITTGRSNSAIGRDALKYNQTGSYNNAFGIRALYWNVSGINNSAFGSFTLADNYGGNYNSAFGTRALQKNYSSSNNAFGSNSLYANLSGYSNNAFGTNTLSNNTTGINNSAFGDQSMLYNSTGSANSAFGAGAMLNNTFSNFNSAFGAAALYSNTLGSTNSAFGNKSLYATTNGYDNTAMGSQSAYSNTEGIGNTSVGLTSLYNTTTGNGNSAFGKNSLNTNVSGNYNLAIGFGADVDAGAYTNAIAIGYNAIVNSSNKIQLGNTNISSVNTSGAITAGSIQNTPIGNSTPSSGAFSTLTSASDLIVNGIKIGIGAGNNYTNAVFGFNALISNTTGAGNIAIGESALSFNSEGTDNISLGRGSLQFNTTGHNNIAFGFSSLNKNTTGYNNFSFGYSSLNKNTTGIDNIAIGAESLINNTTGSENISIGNFSLQNNTFGSNNIAIGSQALMKSNSSSNYNVAIGSFTLYNTLSTIGNTSVGDESMFYNATGNSNTVLGYRSGNSIISGNNNIVIGNSAATSNGTVSNEIVLGNTNNNIIRSQVTSITALSDKRDKKNIQDLSIGLDFIKSIKPRVFKWDKREWYENNISDGSKMENHFTAGFIAQELDSAQTNFNADWLKLVYKSSNERWEATYGNLLPVMVKAIQEQQIIIDDQRQSLEIQRSKLEALEKLVQQIIQAKL